METYNFPPFFVVLPLRQIQMSLYETEARIYDTSRKDLQVVKMRQTKHHDYLYDREFCGLLFELPESMEATMFLEYG